MKFYIIIPVFNSRQITLNCLTLLHSQTYNKYSIIIVDDGSTDGTYQAIKEQFPNVTVLKGDGNLWWAGAVNFALNEILKFASDEDYVLSATENGYGKRS